jgi:hypothetical protein
VVLPVCIRPARMEDFTVMSQLEYLSSGIVSMARTTVAVVDSEGTFFGEDKTPRISELDDTHSERS